MIAEAVLERVTPSRIIAIVRGETGGRLDEVGDVLADAGIGAVEITVNSPAPWTSIARLVSRLGSRLAVGAGTVLTVTEVSRAAEAGATFIVSPECVPDVIDATANAGLASFPGCLSPTEIGVAVAHGAHAVKLFPAASLTPAFIRAMHGPRAGLRMIPTGGVTVSTAAQWLDAGAWAVGIGGDLIGRDITAPGGLERLRARAAQLVAACERRIPSPNAG
jgi:2-dehydro-3-deoxyphosphogluconate aldolase / (4S)-4-hydroxy-2-oxoglutarate aldolase